MIENVLKPPARKKSDKFTSRNIRFQGAYARLVEEKQFLAWAAVEGNVEEREYDFNFCYKFFVQSTSYEFVAHFIDCFISGK